MAPAAWIFFSVVLVLWLNGLYHFGVYSGVRMVVASRLPAGNFVRECVLHPEQAASNLLDVIADNPVRWAIRLFVVCYFGGGGLFSVLEAKVSYFDGLWWAHVTMYTVGYGDLSPVRWVMRVLAMGVITSGFWSLAIMQSALTGRISARQNERRLMRAIDTSELHDDVEQICSELHGTTERLLALASALKDRETNQKGGRP